jgi:hypothetical protein
MSYGLVLSELIKDKEDIEKNINLLFIHIIINNEYFNKSNYYFNFKLEYETKIEINKKRLFIINEKINNYKK